MTTPVLDLRAIEKMAYGENLSRVEIALQLQVDYADLTKFMAEHGMADYEPEPPSSRSYVPLARMVALASDTSLTYWQIGERLGMTGTGVFARLKRNAPQLLELREGKQGVVIAELAQIEELMRTTNLTYTQIGAQLGVSGPAVYQRLKRKRPDLLALRRPPTPETPS